MYFRLLSSFSSLRMAKGTQAGQITWAMDKKKSVDGASQDPYSGRVSESQRSPSANCCNENNRGMTANACSLGSRTFFSANTPTASSTTPAPKLALAEKHIPS
jgi:hypothetical protein